MGKRLRLPLLTTLAQLWRDAVRLDHTCRDSGHTAGSLDLLVSTLAIQHGVKRVTFDADYEPIARSSELNLRLITRPDFTPS